MPLFPLPWLCCPSRFTLYALHCATRLTSVDCINGFSCSLASCWTSSDWREGGEWVRAVIPWAPYLIAAVAVGLCRSRPMFIASQRCSHNGLLTLTFQVQMVMPQAVTVPSSVPLNSVHVFISSHYNPSLQMIQPTCALEFSAKTLTMCFSLPTCLPLAISASWSPDDTWRDKVDINSSVRMCAQ